MSIISTNAPRLRLPDQVNIDFGPVELLGPAFLHLDRAARDRGIYLSICDDFDELAEVNARNRQAWYPLVPMFDPGVGGINAENGFWIRGVDATGETVLTQAARLYVWPDTSFAEEWEARTFMYPDPDRQAQPDERGIANCPAAATLTGRVCHTGALWMRPDFRSQGLGSLMPRLTRAYAYTKWWPEYMFSIVKMAKSQNARNIRRLYGWPHFDGTIGWLNSPHLGDIPDIAICWMTEQETIEDLEQFMPLIAATEQPMEMAA